MKLSTASAMKNKVSFASSSIKLGRMCSVALGALGSASATFAASLVLFSGCASHNSAAHSWLKDGALALSRPVPEAVLDLSSTDNVFGFMPTEPVRGNRWLRIDRARKTVDLMAGRSSLASVTGDGIQALQPGMYTVQLKQKDPVWYAPDSYFTSRALEIPGAGEQERFRRGALGAKALFLDEQTPIHAGPVWRKEIGGLKLSESDVERLFSALEVGAAVEVR